MSVVHQFQWHVITGDTEISIQGQDGIRFDPTSGSTPRLIGIVGGTDGFEICIQNLSGSAVTIVHASGSASSATSKIRMTTAGDLVLAAGKEVWAVLVDPNDGTSDSERGWRLDDG